MIRFFDPATGESGVDVVEVPGTAIKADALKSDSTVENLGNIAARHTEIWIICLLQTGCQRI